MIYRYIIIVDSMSHSVPIFNDWSCNPALYSKQPSTALVQETRLPSAAAPRGSEHLVAATSVAFGDHRRPQR